MNIKNVLIGLVTLVLVGIAGYSVITPSEGVKPTPGAISSPDINSPYFSVGGVRRYSAKTENLIQASTTVCSLQSPAATSTLVSAAIRFNLATSTAAIVDIAKDNTPAATTTKIGGTYYLGAGAQATIVASSSPLNDTTIFSPNQWLVVKIAGAVPAGVGTAPSGVCQATWEAI